jgi:hypothetical protein
MSEIIEIIRDSMEQTIEGLEKGIAEVIARIIVIFIEAIR